MGTDREEVTGKILTFANLVSLVRLLLLPVFWVLYVNYGEGVLAFIVIMVAALTDLLDGQIARSTHTVSRFGKFFDPFVDRIFIIVAVVAIFVVGRLPFWIMLLLLLRDLLMLLLTLYQRHVYKRDFRVIFVGKLTTALLMIGFCMLVLGWPVVPGAGLTDLSFFPAWGSGSSFLGYWFLYVALIFSWIAAAIYFYQGTRPLPVPKTAKSAALQKGGARGSDLPPIAAANKASSSANADQRFAGNEVREGSETKPPKPRAG
ncbi:MAG: CDP-alcohol phosphatidyltransferase family protein [Coriobacteriia bacterium]|nr:CDP-alcohol phosphatidyltransferase family protein [Coriobacteriia bacterium]